MFDPRKPVPKGTTQATQAASRQAKQLRVPDVEINLQRVDTCVTLFETLTVNLNEQPPVVLAAALKYGRAFVQAFQKICIPFFEDILRFEVHKVMKIIKAFQQGTRALQVKRGCSLFACCFPMMLTIPFIFLSLVRQSAA